MNRKPKLTLEQVRDICAKRGLVLLSKEYLRRSAHLHCRCRKCQHTWRPWFPNILRGSGCPMCARAKLATAKPKLSITEVRAHCRKVGLKCLARTYEGRHYPLHCRCTKCDHEWKPTFGKILMGRRCPKCANRKTAERQTKALRELRSHFRGKGIKLVSDSHRVGKQRYCNFVCKRCGYEWTTTVYSMISSGTGCMKCGRKQVARKLTLTTAEVDQRLKSKGVKRLSSFKSTFTPMRLRFTQCGHALSMTLNSVVIGKGCPKCNRHTKVSADEYRNFARQHGGEVLRVARSVSYKSLWKCSQGHEFERPLAQLRYLKHFCPYCFSSYGEASARFIAEEITGSRFEKLRVRGLRARSRYPLELDMYCAPLNLAIEHHGDQHFIPFRHWGGAEQLRNIRKRDAQRRRGCKRMGIELIEIRSLRDKTSVAEFVAVLSEACARRGIRVPRRLDLEDLDRRSLRCATPERVRLLEKFRQHAKDRRFKLLEAHYLGSSALHEVECPKGHRYKVIPNKFMSGRGCPHCPRVAHNRVRVRVGRRIFESIRSAAEQLGVDASTLHEALALGKKCSGYSVKRISH